jgi:hypothetical protein
MTTQRQRRPVVLLRPVRRVSLSKLMMPRLKPRLLLKPW